MITTNLLLLERPCPPHCPPHPDLLPASTVLFQTTPCLLPFEEAYPDGPQVAVVGRGCALNWSVDGKSAIKFIASGLEHLLTEHLSTVADRTAAVLSAVAAEWGRLTGLWHDLGKSSNMKVSLAMHMPIHCLIV